VYGRDKGSTIQDTVLGSVPGYVVDPDGPPTRRHTLHVCQPDFRTRSVKINAVLRWEYRPGSTLFVVWTQSRSGYVPYDAGFDVGRDFERELFPRPADERAAGQAQLLAQFLSEPTQLVEVGQMHVGHAPAAREQGRMSPRAWA